MSNSNNIDALVYASIANNITDNKQLAKLKKDLNMTNIDDNSVFIGKLNEILKDTTLKRAKCNLNADNRIGGFEYNALKNTVSVPVRIPIPAESPINGDDEYSVLRRKMQYYDKNIDVPMSLLSKYTNHVAGNQECNNFYSVYCGNMLNNYLNEKKELGEQYNENEWQNYKPECACYGISRPEEKIEELRKLYADEHDNKEAPYAFNAPHRKCIVSGCAIDKISYLDSASRTGKCPESICTVTNVFSDISAGRSANINNNIKQQCGENSNVVIQDSDAKSVSAGNIKNVPGVPNVSNAPSVSEAPSQGSNTNTNTNPNTSTNTNTSTNPNASTSTNPNANTNTGANTPTASNSSVQGYDAQQNKYDKQPIIPIIMAIMLFLCIVSTCFAYASKSESGQRKVAYVGISLFMSGFLIFFVATILSYTEKLGNILK